MIFRGRTRCSHRAWLSLKLENRTNVPLWRRSGIPPKCSPLSPPLFKQVLAAQCMVKYRAATPRTSHSMASSRLLPGLSRAISFSSGCETICPIPSLSSSLFRGLVWVFARPLVMRRFITSCGLHAQSILGSFLLVFHLRVRPSGPLF